MDIEETEKWSEANAPARRKRGKLLPPPQKDNRVKQQAYIEIAEQSFAHLHTLSLQWHLKKKMGNVVRSMDRGTDAANNLITYLFLYLVPAIAECIATVGRLNLPLLAFCT